MTPEMNVFRLMSILLFLHFAQSDVQGKVEGDISEKKVWDRHYNKEKNRSDLVSLPFRIVTQLYSRNSGRHIRIHEDRTVDANGEENDNNAKLIIESDRFGSVRIRGSVTNLYLCIDRKGRLRGRAAVCSLTLSEIFGRNQSDTWTVNRRLNHIREFKARNERGIGRDNCVFKEEFAANAYTEFKSAKYPNRYIAFTRKGATRTNRTHPGTKAVQFMTRPLRVYKRLYKGNRLDNKQRQRITLSVKKWKQFKKWLKWRKQQKENSLGKSGERTTTHTRTVPSTDRPHNVQKTEGNDSQLHQSSMNKP